MLLQVNSCSIFPLKFHPLPHAGCNKTFRLPLPLALTQINGLANKSQSKKKSIKCSSQSSLNLTNKIRYIGGVIDRNKKSLNKSTVPLALQDGAASNFKDDKIVSTNFVDFLSKKLDALYRLSVPYYWAGNIVGILSVSFLPVQSPADLTPAFFQEVLKSTVPAIMMSNFVTAINQLSDIEIDKVNKPHRPLPSGDLSTGEGIAVAVASPLMGIGMGVMLRSPPLVIGFIVWWIVGAAYSIDLPLLGWKGSPLMAAATMIILNVVVIQFPYFIHVQKYVLGRPLVFTKPLLFAAVFMPILNVALAFLKDLPDVEGDKKFGVQTLAIILGRERVFSISVNMLLMAYGAAVLVGASSPFLLCKLATMIGHSALAAILWCQSRTIDLSNIESMQSFYIFVFKLYYVETFLVHFVR